MHLLKGKSSKEQFEMEWLSGHLNKFLQLLALNRLLQKFQSVMISLSVLEALKESKNKQQQVF